MTVSPEDWQTLSRLLDVALDLPGQERDGWLRSLAPPNDVFREQLARMLASRAHAETRDFMDTLPKIADAGVAGGADADLHAGAVVGPYSLVRELGRGGMGTVWLADRCDGQLNRAVALKLPHSMLPQGQLAERLARERDILARLAHPHIARLYDAGIDARGQPYLALEYIDGESLLSYCARRRLGLRERIALFLQALSAVQYAHSQLVVHRDLKPSNMIVTAQGEVRLLDFGIAKMLKEGEANETELTQLGGRAMTPRYASPEQITGLPLGTASDIYSLGVVLCELLSGALPYRPKRESRGALEEAILSAEPVRPSAVAGDPAQARDRGTTAPRLASALKGDLDTIVLKALRKPPAERYASAEAMAADLRRHLNAEPVLARPDALGYRAGRFLRRNWIGASATAAVALAILAGAGLALWQARVAREEALAARAVRDFLQDIFKANSGDNPDPAKARLTTARELLDIGAGKIDKALADAPAAKVEVLNTITGLYYDLGLNDQAVDFAMRSLALLRSLHGDTPAVASQMCDVAIMMQASRRTQERGPLLREALRILDRYPGEAAATRANALRMLAILEQDTGKPEAEAYAREAVGLSDRVSGLRDRILAHRTLGLVLRAKGDLEGADASLSRAVELLPQAQDYPRRQVALLDAYYGDARFSLGRIADAEKAYRHGLEIARATSGEEHLDTVLLEYRLGRLLFESARTAEGFALLEAADDRLVRLRGANDSRFRPTVLAAKAAARAQRGDLERAEADLVRSTELMVKSGLLKGIVELLYLHADVLLDLGRPGEAARSVERAQGYLQGGTFASPDALEMGRRVRSRLDLASGSADTARQAFETERPRLAGRERRSMLDWDNLLAWGEIALQLGDAATARAAAGQVTTRSVAQPGLFELREMRAALLEGRVLLASGDARAAAPRLQRAVELAERHLDPARSLALADALLARAQSRAPLGAREAMKSDVARAKAILRSHPSVEPRLRQELRALEGGRAAARSWREPAATARATGRETPRRSPGAPRPA